MPPPSLFEFDGRLQSTAEIARQFGVTPAVARVALLGGARTTAEFKAARRRAMENKGRGGGPASRSATPWTRPYRAKFTP